MLKTRIVIVLTLDDGVLKRTKRFVADYRYTQSFLSVEAVDEVVIVDIGQDRGEFHKAAKAYADRCFSPITIGGHIETMDDCKRILHELGGDKALIGTALVERPEFAGEIAEKFGNQFLVAGIDVTTLYNRWHVTKQHGTVTTTRMAVEWAQELEERGAGEILLTDIDRDGSLQGYNLPLVRAVADSVSIPVVAAGGCGGWAHMAEGVLEGHASAVSTSVIHHFTDTSLIAAKKYLGERGVPVRLDLQS